MASSNPVLDTSSVQNFRKRQKQGRVAEDIAVLLRAHIKSEALTVGDELPSEASLAEQLGVSQRAVRDALRILANQGALVTRQGRRATIQEPQPLPVMYYFERGLDDSEQGIADLMELRIALESMAASLAAVRASHEDIVEIRADVEALLECGDDDILRVELELSFHGRIAAASGNVFINDIVAALRGALGTQIQKGFSVNGSHDPDRSQSDSLHVALVEALEGRDARRAGEYASAIVAAAQQAFIERGGSPIRETLTSTGADSA